MTIIDTDNLCNNCPKAGDDTCSECLRTTLHDMIHGNDHSYIPDLYSGPTIHIDAQSDKDIEQTTSLIDLLTSLLDFLGANATRRSIMKSFIRKNQKTWDRAETLAKEKCK